MNLPLKPVGGVCGEAGGVCIGVQGAPSANFEVGSVGFGPMWGTEDSMAESIVRISRELEEAQAQCAVYEAERSILIRERDEARDCFKAAMTTAETYKRERDEARGALRSFVKQMRQQAAVFKREDLRDNSRWSIFNEGRAQALEKMAEEMKAST